MDATPDADGYIEQSFTSVSGATQIETCDSTENACFIVGSDGKPSMGPSLVKDEMPLYNFASGADGKKNVYSELAGYSINGAGNIGASGTDQPGAYDGECGKSNLTTVANTYALTDLCDVGNALAPTFNMSSKMFEWNCNGFNGGRNASCSANAAFTALVDNGICGSDSDYVCNEPLCFNNSKTVYEGDQCTSGNDCVDNKISDALTLKMCTVTCTYKGDKVASGQPCDAGITCRKDTKQRFSSMQAIKNKCNAGFSGDISNDGTNWSWTCFGLNGGTNVSCSAKSALAVNGVCNNSTIGYCSVGTADEPRFNNYKNQWEWKCGGFNGGDFASCSRPAFGFEGNNASCVSGKNVTSLYDLKYLSNTYNPAGLCSGGVPSFVNFSNNTYSWACKSTNSNASITSSSCSAISNTNSYADGACNDSMASEIQSSSDISCTSGYPANIIYIPAFNELKWDCKGFGINSSAPVKDAKCLRNVKSVSIDGKCGSPMNMFVSSSGAQYPSMSKELKNASLFSIPPPAQALQFQLCKSGYPTSLNSSGNSSGQSWADTIMKFGKTPNNQCDYSGNSYVSSDCMNLKINIPFIGDLQIFHMTMPWQWTCNGVGGSNKNCFIFNPSMFFKQDGKCGSASGGIFADASLVMDRCETGYSSDLATSYSGGTNKITWTCKGLNFGSDSSCSANLRPTGKVDGSCGNSNDQSGLWNYSSIVPCINGVYSDLAIMKNSTNKTVQWSWKCKGVSGGVTVDCLSNANWKDAQNNQVTVLNGVCNILSAGIYKSTSDIYSAGACNYGLIKNVRYDSASNKFKWNCVGSDDGNVDNCEVTAGF